MDSKLLKCESSHQFSLPVSVFTWIVSRKVGELILKMLLCFTNWLVCSVSNQKQCKKTRESTDYKRCVRVYMNLFTTRKSQSFNSFTGIVIIPRTVHPAKVPPTTQNPTTPEAIKCKSDDYDDELFKRNPNKM